MPVDMIGMAQKLWRRLHPTSGLLPRLFHDRAPPTCMRKLPSLFGDHLSLFYQILTSYESCTMASVRVQSTLSACRKVQSQLPFTSRRSFSRSAVRSKEIQDAYILSAVRTPVAVVSIERSRPNESLPSTDTHASSMVPSPRFQLPSSAPMQSRKPSHVLQYQWTG